TISSENKGEPLKAFPHPKNFTERLRKWNESLESFENSELDEATQFYADLIANHNIFQDNGCTDYPIYTTEDVTNVIHRIREKFTEFGGSSYELVPKNEDTPIPFEGDVFLTYLSILAQETGNEQYLEFLIERIRTLLGDSRMNSIIGDETEKELD